MKPLTKQELENLAEELRSLRLALRGKEFTPNRNPTEIAKDLIRMSVSISVVTEAAKLRHIESQARILRGLDGERRNIMEEPKPLLTSE